MGCANRRQKDFDIESIYLKTFEKELRRFDLKPILLKRIVRSLKNANSFNYPSVKIQSKRFSINLYDNHSFIIYLEEKQLLNIYTFFTILSLYCPGTSKEKACLLFSVYNEHLSAEISHSNISDMIRNLIKISCDIIPRYIVSMHPDDEELKSYAHNIASVTSTVSTNIISDMMKNRENITKDEFLEILTTEYEYLLKPKWTRIYCFENYYRVHVYQEIDYYLIMEFLDKNFNSFGRRIKKPINEIN